MISSGNCSQPGTDGIVLGTTAETDYIIGKHLYQHFKDDAVVFIHDHDGDVIACGTVAEDERKPTVCLCGACADCEDSDDPFCNKHDSCLFTGNGDAKPHSCISNCKFQTSPLPE